MIRYFSIFALRQLVRYKAQSLLTIIGVAIGAANVVMLISITDLGRHQASQIISELGANLLILTPFVDSTSSPLSRLSTAGTTAHLPDYIRVAVNSAPEIDSTAAVLVLPGNLTTGEAQAPGVGVLGTTAAFLELRGHEVDAGRWLTPDDIENNARVICLGKTIKDDLFGEESALGRRVELKDVQFEVVGEMVRKGKIGFENVDNYVFIPLTTVQELYGLAGFHGMLVRYRDDVNETDAISAIQARIAGVLKEEQILEETISIFTVKEATRLMDQTLSIFRSVLFGIASIALLVAGIGIMNVMLMRVLNRRLEIGVRLTVGATPGSVVVQFLVESVAQAVIGALLGIALGIGGVASYCKYAQWEPYVSPLTIILAGSFSILVGVLFGAYPAYKAARVDPIRALRAEF